MAESEVKAEGETGQAGSASANSDDDATKVDSGPQKIIPKQTELRKKRSSKVIKKDNSDHIVENLPLDPDESVVNDVGYRDHLMPQMPGSVRVTEEGLDGEVVVSETHQHVSPTLGSFVLVLVVVLLFQASLFIWKKLRPRSFKLCSLAALWLFPLLLSLYHSYTRFVVIWTIFSVLHLYVFRTTMLSQDSLASSETGISKQRDSDSLLNNNGPNPTKTARQIYQWFYWTLRFCNLLVALSYFVVALAFFIPSVSLFSPELCIMLLYYGLYFGLLSRDLAEVCTEKILQNLGFFSAKGILPRRTVPLGLCAVCNELLQKDASPSRSQKMGKRGGNSEKERLILDGGGLLDRRAVDGGMLKRMGKKQSPLSTNQESKDVGCCDKFNFIGGMSELMRYFDRASDPTVKLTNCQHSFHEFCLRGWTLLSGKRHMCPVCAERMHHRDSARLFHSIWTKHEKMFGSILTVLRYLLVWYPLLMIVLKVVFFLFPLETSHVTNHTVRYHLGHPHAHSENPES